MYCRFGGGVSMLCDGDVVNVWHNLEKGLVYALFSTVNSGGLNEYLLIQLVSFPGTCSMAGAVFQKHSWAL